MLVYSARGYAALSLTAAGVDVLTVEYKVNFLNPRRGRRFLATGRVVKPGRTLTLCSGEVVAIAANGARTLVASMLSTILSCPREHVDVRTER
jgi:acyl-coenzyme A thioesterase PaaI-like protein